MSEQQLVISSPSPTLENKQALGSRIEETVQMSTYQIKKGLEAKRKALMTNYEELKQTEAALDVTTCRINTRLIAKMQDYLQGEALIVLNAIYKYVVIGESGSYFDDNRNNDVLYEDIAQALVTVDKNISYKTLLHGLDEPITHIYMHGAINIFGSTQSSTYHFNEEECVFSPEQICKNFMLETDEIEHIAAVETANKNKARANKEINDIDLKLKDMNSLTEDIRYTMLTEKNAADGDTTVIDIANKIATAFINGTDPSTLLLSK